MRVEVYFHETARAYYEAWQARLSQPPTGDPMIARVHAEELVRHFRDCGGVPKEAHFRPDLIPPSWVWRYTSDTWVRFRCRERRLGLWGGTVREVIVISVASHPPG